MEKGYKNDKEKYIYRHVDFIANGTKLADN
jgi:hypothetical protein